MANKIIFFNDLCASNFLAFIDSIDTTAKNSVSYSNLNGLSQIASFLPGKPEILSVVEQFHVSMFTQHDASLCKSPQANVFFQ